MRTTLLCLCLAAMACGGTTDPEPDPLGLPPSATNVRLDDAANAQDVTDFELYFEPPADESGIAEYRIVLAKEPAGLTADDAAALASARFTSVVPNGSASLTRLPATLLDADGDPVGPGQVYRALVISVGDGTNAEGHRLAASRSAIDLQVSTVKITYLGNDGVLIQDSARQVLIDALHRTTQGWILLSASELNRVERGLYPYDHPTVALTTHNHGDHFHPQSVSAYLSGNGSTSFIGPPQVTSGLGGNTRILNVSPAFGTQVDTVVGGVPISVYHVRHFNQFGNDFSTVENYAYLVTIGGKRYLHLGDVEYSAANLDSFGFDTLGIDAVFIPTFNTLLSQTNADIIQSIVNPAHVVALHFQGQAVQSEAAAAAQFYGTETTTFTQSLQVLRR